MNDSVRVKVNFRHILLAFCITERVNGRDVVTFTYTKVNRDSSITIALATTISHVFAMTIRIPELLGQTTLINNLGTIGKSVFITSTAVNWFVPCLTNAFTLVCDVFTI